MFLANTLKTRYTEFKKQVKSLYQCLGSVFFTGEIYFIYKVDLRMFSSKNYCLIPHNLIKVPFIIILSELYML